MTSLDFSRRDAEDLIDGGLSAERVDLLGVIELTTFMRAVREAEPPPPMRADLLCQIDPGAAPTAD